MDLDFLFAPFERADMLLSSLLASAPAVAVVALAAALGLRHASDPDHLIAVTALVAADGDDRGAAARIGAWWGAGHAAVLLALGLPLIALGSSMPPWFEHGAERLVGVVVVILAARVLWQWVRSSFGRTRFGAPRPAVARGRHHAASRHACAVGVLHGLAGTGAVVLLLVGSLPPAQALVALAVFAPMSVISMALCTSGFSWLLTRRLVEPLFRRALLPALALFGVVFGSWYANVL